MSQNEKKPFRTVPGSGRFEFSEKKSRFIGHVEMVPDEDAARQVLKKIRTEFPDATHHVWAYIVDNRELYSDDGEPSGTSGKPTLMVLAGRNLINVVCVTTRYYGGTKLGCGGLVRAYSDACAGAVEKAGIVEMIEATDVAFTLDYNMIGTLEHFLPNVRAEIIGRKFGQDVEFTLRLPTIFIADLDTFVTNLTRGKSSIDIREKSYVLWDDD